MIALAVLSSCTSGGDGAAQRDPGAGDRSTTTSARPTDDGSRATTTTSVTSADGSAPTAELPASVQEADDLLTVLAPVVPIPDDTRACVAAKLAQDPELVDALARDGAKGDVPDGVMDLGSACMEELHALPAFLDGLEDTAEGGLSTKQRACVEEGYRGLGQEAREAAVAEALGATRGTGAADEIETMLHDCGVKVGG